MINIKEVLKGLENLVGAEFDVDDIIIILFIKSAVYFVLFSLAAPSAYHSSPFPLIYT